MQLKQDGNEGIGQLQKVTPASGEDQEVELFKEQPSDIRKAVKRQASTDRVDMSHLLEVKHAYLVAYTACYGLSVW